MGHRALVAYERPDGRYNIHYSHNGAFELQLRNKITRGQPFADDTDSKDVREHVSRLLRLDELAEVDWEFKGDTQAIIRPTPLVVGCRFETILAEHLDFLQHEALYVVNMEFEVTAYRTVWFGLFSGCEHGDEMPTVGNGILRAVRWDGDEPITDDDTQGRFRALRSITSDLVEREIFSTDEAIEYVKETVEKWASDDEGKLIIQYRTSATETQK